jgi:30S ribosomal protein S31
MGKGDKRTKRGKIFKGSYGKSRPHDPDKKTGDAKGPKPRQPQQRPR